MAKSKPIGVRFDLDLLEVFREDKIADTPQSALNFLTEFYRTNREKIDFKKMFEESKLFEPRVQVNDLTNTPPKTNYTINTKKKKEKSEKELTKGEMLRKLREGNL